MLSAAAAKRSQIVQMGIVPLGGGQNHREVSGRQEIAGVTLLPQQTRNPARVV